MSRLNRIPALLALVLVLAHLPTNLRAQVTEIRLSDLPLDENTFFMQYISEELANSLTEIPLSVRRIAIYRVSYDEKLFDRNDVSYIKDEVERVIKKNSPITILSPLEFEPNNAVKITITDSSLKMSNIQGRSFVDSSMDEIFTAADKYNIQGLMELSLQRKEIEGIILTIRLISARSQELLWSKAFRSNVVKIDTRIDSSRKASIKVGVNSVYGQFVNGARLPAQGSTSAQVYDVGFTYQYVEPLDEDYRSLFGFFAGGHLYRVGNSEFETYQGSFVEAGLMFKRALSKKNNYVDGNRIELASYVSAMVPLSKKKGIMITVAPAGLHFNLTRTFGFYAEPRYILSGEMVYFNNNTENLQYERFSYGIGTIIRF